AFLQDPGCRLRVRSDWNREGQVVALGHQLASIDADAFDVAPGHAHDIAGFLQGNTRIAHTHWHSGPVTRPERYTQTDGTASDQKSRGVDGRIFDPLPKPARAQSQCAQHTQPEHQPCALRGLGLKAQLATLALSAGFLLLGFSSDLALLSHGAWRRSLAGFTVEWLVRRAGAIDVSAFIQRRPTCARAIGRVWTKPSVGKPNVAAGAPSAPGCCTRYRF